MCTDTETNNVTATHTGVGDAVGVDKAQWFVAVVKHNTEKSTGEKLLKLGYECYVPVQKEIHIMKDGRRSKVARCVIPSIVFVKCTESIRKEIVLLPFISRFMTNKAGRLTNAGHKPLATIPTEQIERLQFMLGNSDVPVTFSVAPYKKGDLVKVIRGKLLGLIGEVQVIDDKHSEITVSLDFLGNAKLAIETINVEPVS